MCKHMHDSFSGAEGFSSMKHRSVPKEKCPSCLSLWVPLGDTPSNRNKTLAPVKPPGGQILRSPRPNITSVLTRSLRALRGRGSSSPPPPMGCTGLVGEEDVLEVVQARVLQVILARFVCSCCCLFVACDIGLRLTPCCCGAICCKALHSVLYSIMWRLKLIDAPSLLK